MFSSIGTAAASIGLLAGVTNIMITTYGLRENVNKFVVGSIIINAIALTLCM